MTTAQSYEAVGLQPPEFYQNFNLAKEYGWTPSIVNMLGGVSNLDSYTPLGAARQTVNGYEDYLQRTVGDSAAQVADSVYAWADKLGINRDNAYAAAFGFAPQQPKFCADKTGKVVPCDSPDRVQGGATSPQGGGTNNPTGGAPVSDFPVEIDPVTGKEIPCGISTIWLLGGIGGYGKQVPEGTPGARPVTRQRTCDRLPDPSGVGKKLDELGLGFDSTGVSSRVILVAAGVLLIVAVIISWR